MARYDWPASAESGDDANARGRYNGRYLPVANVRPADGSEPPPPPAARAARGRADAKAAPSGGTHLWLPLGPTTVTGGQASGDPRVAGRIREIAVEPTTGDRVYAASASGGVWFSDSRGVSWRPLDAFAVTSNRDTLFPIGNTLACGALHVHWGASADGSGDTVTVGTGEPGGSGGTPGGKIAGVGILRATGPATGTAWSVEGPASLRGEAFWRIVEDPGSEGQLFAATTAGLFIRNPTGVWSPVTGLAPDGRWAPPHNTHVIDVAVTRLPGPRMRIWALRYGQLNVADIANPADPLPAATPVFQQINLPGAMNFTQMVLAVGPDGTLWVLGRTPATGTQVIDPAQIWKVNATAAIASVAATAITGAPETLFGSDRDHDQSGYDICLAVHPDHADTLYMGGSTLRIDGVYNASLYRAVVAGTAATPTLVGKGVHADVHGITVGPVTSGSNRAVWVACDGGVFLSTADGTADTYVARNNDLAVLQPGFVANHATNDGILAAGMQDNGTCERVGDTVWREVFQGDGGGVAYDPVHDRRFFRQYIRADWASSDGTGIAPVFRRGATAPANQQTSEQVENGASLFYSGAASVAHGGTTHLAIGTDRVWYSPDWGASWVTLPTGTDPRAADSPDLAQDVLAPGTAAATQYNDTVRTFLCCTSTYHGTNIGGTGLLTVRWAPRPDDGGNNRIRLLALWNGGLTIIAGTRATGSTGAWTWTTETTEAIRAINGAAEQTDVDNAAPVAFLPAVDIVNDVFPHDPTRGAHGSCYLATVGGAGSGAGHEIDTVWWYDGDGHFVPTGLRRAHPRGVWSGTRITAPALSVVVDPTDSDIVYVGTSVGVIQGSLTMVDNGSGVMEPHWAWTAFDNGLPEGAVHDLAIFSHDGVKLLRAALQARGLWETDLATAVAQPATYLRVYASDTRRRRPVPLSGPPTKGEPGTRWDASPDIVFDTTGLIWGPAGPSEVDLFQLPFAGEVGEHAAQAFSNRTFKVHVLVHHRWFDPAQPADVKVALLRHDAPADGGEVALGGIWATLLAVSGGGAVPGVLPGGWTKASADFSKSPTAAIDPRSPRAVTFDVDLSGLDDGTHVCFLAVVMCSQDPINAAEITKPDAEDAATVDELVLHSRHAAARTLVLT
jgi:hypothetical protein